MGGAGMFRPEVTQPLGCDVPVLAWGLGLERLAMFRYDLSSIGELYRARLTGSRRRRYAGSRNPRRDAAGAHRAPRSTASELVEHLQHLGCDVEGFATVRRYRCTALRQHDRDHRDREPAGALRPLRRRLQASARGRWPSWASIDVIRMELLAVRPDMFDPGGLARVLRNYLGETAEPARYELAPPAISVEVDPGVASDSLPPALHRLRRGARASPSTTT